MQRGWVKVWRKITESPVWSMPPLYLKVWIWILMRVDYATGVLPKFSLQTIANEVSWAEEDGRFISPAKSYIHKIIHWMKHEKMLSIAKNGQILIITVVNWQIYTNQELASENGPENGSRTVPPHPPNNDKKELKERTLKDLRGAVAPPLLLDLEVPEPEKPKTRKPRKASVGVDPDTNPKTFIDHVHSGYSPEQVPLDNVQKYVVRIKAKLKDLKRGCPDPQEKLRSLFDRFMQGEVDHLWPMNTGAPHTLESFLSDKIYPQLIESGNGRRLKTQDEIEMDKLKQWARQEDAKEAEREMEKTKHDQR